MGRKEMVDMAGVGLGENLKALVKIKSMQGSRNEGGAQKATKELSLQSSFKRYF